jgi:hypothetical protein
MAQAEGRPMTRTKVLSIESEIRVAYGAPSYDRRLTDRILAAFNHAYATGERGVAAVLRRALKDATGAGKDCPGARRATDPLHQADLWVAFVDARETYRRKSEATVPDRPAVETARDAMIEAYKRWSFS